jgi:hypothetical protein
LNKKALLGMGSAFFIIVYTDVYTALAEQTKKHQNNSDALWGINLFNALIYQVSATDRVALPCAGGTAV